MMQKWKEKNCIDNDLQHKNPLHNPFLFYLENGEILKYGKERLLYSEGEKAAGIFMIKKGVVKIFKTGRQHSESILYLAVKGDVLGLHAVMNGESYGHSAKTMEATSVYFLSEKKIPSLVKDSPSLLINMMQLLCMEIDLVENKINKQIQKNSRQRLAESLLSLSNIYSSVNIHLPLNDLANLSGTSPTYLVKLLSEFNKNGWIEHTKDAIRVVDTEELLKIAG